jgi:hypothetical protein
MVGRFRRKNAVRRILTTDSGNFSGKIPEKKRKKKGTKKEQKRNKKVESCVIILSSKVVICFGQPEGAVS